MGDGLGLDLGYTSLKCATKKRSQNHKKQDAKVKCAPQKKNLNRKKVAKITKPNTMSESKRDHHQPKEKHDPQKRDQHKENFR